MAQGHRCDEDGTSHSPNETVAISLVEGWLRRSFETVAVAVAVTIVVLVCYWLQDWFLLPHLLIVASLLWVTRRDRWATVPGLVAGFFIGVITSAGIGLADTVCAGLLIAAWGAMLNAVLRGHWRSGIAAMIGVVAGCIIVSYVV